MSRTSFKTASTTAVGVAGRGVSTRRRSVIALPFGSRRRALSPVPPMSMASVTRPEPDPCGEPDEWCDVFLFEGERPPRAFVRPSVFAPMALRLLRFGLFLHFPKPLLTRA